MHAPRPIRPLDETLINQIAAGEVIERPASAVKELVENSLDAGARNIDIHIEQGGQRLIRITDDGCGISKQELQLALLRHATSKIRTYQDLTRVRSMGFRGEALASIAAVAELSLTSRTADSNTAWRLLASPAGLANEAQPVAAPVGTSITVSQLFFSTPVRRRFLRSVRTEFHHILDWVRRLALANPAVGFRLTHDKRCILQLQALAEGNGLNSSAARQRIDRVFGRGFTQQSDQLEAASDGMRLCGFLGAPATARSQSDRQYLFVNRRLIRDQGLMHAVRLAYEGQVAVGMHPQYLLWLDLDPLQVDVNVHPAKSEVRFSQPRQVHDFVAAQALRSIQPLDSDWQSVQPKRAVVSVAGSPDAHTLRPERVAEPWQLYQQQESGRPSQGKASRQALELPAGEHYGAVGRSFLLRIDAAGITVLNLALALPRYLQDSLQQEFEHGEIIGQPLLIPAEIELDGALLKPLQSLSAQLSGIGLEFRHYQGRTVRLLRLPRLMRGMQTSQLMAALPELIAQPRFDAVAWIESLSAGQLPTAAELATSAACWQLWQRLHQALQAARIEDCVSSLGENELSNLFKQDGQQ